MLNKLKAFILGVYEFRNGFTRNFKDVEISNFYEWGREIAHKITFRKYEQY